MHDSVLRPDPFEATGSNYVAANSNQEGGSLNFSGFGQVNTERVAADEMSLRCPVILFKARVLGNARAFLLGPLLREPLLKLLLLKPLLLKPLLLKPLLLKPL